MIIIKKAEIGYGFSIRKTPLPKTGNMMKADTALPSDEQKTCPKCQKPISSPNAVICIECGFELKTGRKISAAALTETPQPFPMSKMPPNGFFGLLVEFGPDEVREFQIPDELQRPLAIYFFVGTMRI